MELFDLKTGFVNGTVSVRKFITNVKLSKNLEAELVIATKFLPESADTIERTYCYLNNITEIQKCPACGKPLEFSGRYKLGYRETCGSRECRNIQIAKSHTGKTDVSENRVKAFKEWQDTLTDGSVITDDVIKQNIKFASLADLITAPVLVNYLTGRFTDSFSVRESVERIHKGVEKKPLCPVCGSPVNWVGKQSKMFTTYCSTSCSNSSPDVVSKKQESDKAKNGGKLGWVLSNADAGKIQNRKDTLDERYGTRNLTKIPGVMDRIRETSRKNWGTDSPMQNPDVRKRYADSMKERYNVENPTKNREIYLKLLATRNKTNREKGYSVQSEYEKRLEILLRKVWPDLDIQHFDRERYPWRCDFYVPSEDLFIEYNGSHFHHGHPFNASDPGDIAEVERLKACAERLKDEDGRDHNQYNTIMYQWTDLDPRKREFAERTGIRILELWHPDDAENERLIREFVPDFKMPGLKEYMSPVMSVSDAAVYSAGDGPCTAVDDLYNRILGDRAAGLVKSPKTVNCTKELAAELVGMTLDREFRLIQDISFPEISVSPVSDDDCVREFRRIQAGGSPWSATPSKIIRRFHRSIIYARKGGSLSPYEGWRLMQADKDLLGRFLFNRFRYADWFKKDGLRRLAAVIDSPIPECVYGMGLSCSGKYPEVSYFRPGLAAYLIRKYLDGFETVFDPFSGYSGRMIGALACGKAYTGQDLCRPSVEESAEIEAFLKSRFNGLPEVSLRLADSSEETGSYECLLTCSPYEDIEKWPGVESAGRTCDDWIDICLDHYKCGRYVFVTDGNIVRYRPFVRDVIKNRSHFGTNEEYVVVIDT